MNYYITDFGEHSTNNNDYVIILHLYAYVRILLIGRPKLNYKKNWFCITLYDNQ